MGVPEMNQLVSEVVKSMKIILFFLQENWIEELTRQISFSHLISITTVIKEKIRVVRKDGFYQVLTISDQGILVSMRELVLPSVILSSKTI